MQDCSEEPFVEDDDELLSSEEISISNEAFENINSLPEKQEIGGVGRINNYNDKENIEKMPHSNANAANVCASTSANKKANFNYKDLIPYTHCCPLTYKEFRSNSNISQLVREFCEKRNLGTAEQRIVLHRSYILFYLAPEHRKVNPIKKIKLSEHCPSHIREKFFNIPSKLYLKEEKIKKLKKVTFEIETDTINKRNNCSTQPIACLTVNQQETDKSNKGEDSVMECHASVPSATILNSSIIADRNYEVATQSMKNMFSNNCTEKSNDCIQQIIIPAANLFPVNTSLNLPVSLDEFKKCTYYEEIIDKLFKIKSQNNNELYLKYKNSEKAFHTTLVNYYRAFYLLPCIRKVCPIRLKPTPNFLKQRLLRVPDGVKIIPLKNFKLEQLVSPYEPTVNQKQSQAAKISLTAVLTEESHNEEKVEQPYSVSPNVPTVSRKEIAAEEQSQEDEVPQNSKSLLQSPQTFIKTKIKVENMPETLITCKPNSPLGGAKRTVGETGALPSKRPKVQTTEKNKQTKEKLYKQLLPYRHCCPVSYSQFVKYTNVSDSFAGYCQRRYNSIEKLPFMLHRAYILFYLAPQYRKFKPFNQLRILDDCPINLKSRMLEIPAHLYLRRENTGNLLMRKQGETENKLEVLAEATAFKESKQQHLSERVATTGKQSIEILENRLLPPTTLPFPSPPSLESTKCSNGTCIFHHLTHFDFMKQTNILTILSQPHEMNVIRDVFKRFIYKAIKEQTCDTDYVINSSFMCTVLKYRHICENCESDIKPVITLNSTVASMECENERISNVVDDTVTERAALNEERIVSAANKEKDDMRDSTMNESSIAKQTQSVATNDYVQQKTNMKPLTRLWKSLKTDKIYVMLRCKLLEKLNRCGDSTVDFSSDTFKTFIQCNEIPLRQILNDSCDNNEDVVQRILSDDDVFEALQRYYYCQYLTNKHFALKYPAKIKEQNVEEKCSGTNENKTNNNVDGNDLSEKKSYSTVINPNITQQEFCYKLSLSEKSLSNYSTLEKAKRIFFRNVNKTDTLHYVLRTSFGFKQLILRAVLSLTLTEFLELTNVYEGNELYTDKHVGECMYRYVFSSPLVWPTNLYINLKNLCKFLYKKNMTFENYATMLKYISPKLLHWSILLPSTNIMDCVKIDYEKRTGKLLDTYDTKKLKEECIEYYNRCWKYEKWMGETPIVNEDFYTNFSIDNVQADTTILEEAAAPEVCNDVSSNDVEVLDSKLGLEVGVETITEADTSTKFEQSTEEFNCVVLPNTQQQIEMLPADQKDFHDPLSSHDNAFVTILSQSSTESSVSVGELLEQIKGEPIDNKLLSHLQFWEDVSGNIQCKSREEEIINLDNTQNSQLVTNNLPPSEIDFEDAPEYILGDKVSNDDHIINSFTNLSQHMRSSCESHDEILIAYHKQPQTAEIISSQVVQFPSVSLTSSGENERYESSQEKNVQETHLDYHSNFKEIETDVANLTVEKAPKTPMATEPVSANLLTNNKVFGTCSGPSHGSTFALSICRTTSNTSAPNKSKKIVAKVQPLKLVPQIQHNTRPLHTVPAHVGGRNKCNEKLQSESDTLATKSIMLTLKPTRNNSKSTVQSNQNCSVQLQLAHSGTHIYISQELNENCSIFDDTSLLRIADHNYYQQNKNNSISITSQITNDEKASRTSNTIKDHQQMSTINSTNQHAKEKVKHTVHHGSTEANTEHCTRITTQQNVCSEAENSSAQTVHGVKHSSCMSQDYRNKSNVCSSDVAASTSKNSSLQKDTNDKVNSLVLIQTNDLVTSYTRIIIPPQPIVHRTYEMVRKPCLHREILQLHYFKELTTQHIGEYLLQSSEIGKSYTEALVVSGNFKTRISNRSISALFTFWPQNLQRDFLLVLDDLKEFHYVVYERISMQKQEDLRVRILFWLLYTAPSFTLCQFIYEASNPEFSHCESIKNGNNPSYERKPFKCLTNAVSSKVLRKLKEIKFNLKMSK